MVNHFIINPTAGKGEKQVSLLEKIKKACLKESKEYQVHVSEYSGHGTQIAKEICEKGDPARIYACGGDGTLCEVCIGVIGYENIEVGCIPCGSGNDFVRNFKQADFFNITKQINGVSKPIDIMSVNDGENIKYSINAVSIGFDSEVAMRMSRYKNMPLVSGSMSYVLSILFSLNKLKGLDMNFYMDNKKISGKFLLCMCGNGGYYGGGFNGAPLAKLDDGFMDVVAVDDIKLSKIPKLVGLYQKGAHKDPNFGPTKDIIHSYKTSYIRVTSSQMLPITVDGEGMYSKEFTIEIEKQALNFILPK